MDKPVVINGCFDLLHEGHLGFIRLASLVGNGVIVFLNSDASIRKLKNRPPVFSDQHRAALLRSNYYVREVYIFEEETPVHSMARLVDSLNPGMYLTSTEHIDSIVVKFMQSKFIPVLYAPRFSNFPSTTSLLAKIRALPEGQNPAG